MGSANLYTIGLTGLQSSNARISTTGQNTSNVDTEGYSRQRTDTVSSRLGGVRLEETSRLVDHFVSAQTRTDSANFAYHDTYHSMMSISDNLLAEDSVSLTGYLNKAFNALQQANNDPASSSLRKLAHSSLNTLVEQYKTLSSIVTRQEDLVDGQLSATLTDVNAITAKISDLNGKILREESVGSSPANELRDQQEELARELSQYLKINAQFTPKGLMNVHLDTGQPLVMDQNPTEVKVKVDPLDPKKLQLAIDFGDYDAALKMDGLGGRVGALVDFRTEFTAYADRTLGQHAISIADAMNLQNAKGIDANGNFGNDLFSLADVNVYTSAENVDKLPDISIRVSSGGAQKITKDTYELSRTDDSRFSIIRYGLDGQANGAPVYFEPSKMTPSSSGHYHIEELGLDVRVSDFSTIDDDDVFRFIPTERAAKHLSLEAKNGDVLAFSAPIAVNANPENLSDSQISISAVTNTDHETSAFGLDGSMYPSAPHKIYFTSPSSYVVHDSTGAELAKVENVSHYTNLLEQAGLAEEAGFDVSVSSMPERGDEFTVDTDNIGPADNYNGLALVDLQNQDLVAGKDSLTKSFAGFISYVGVKTAEAQGYAESSEVVMNDSMARRDRLSAVSLDEEAVNLMKYQQAYSASAQVVTAARETFETLLNVVR